MREIDLFPTPSCEPADGKLVVLRFPTYGSGAIPIKVAAPIGAQLLTWSILGPSKEGRADLICLMIVSLPKETELSEGSPVSIQTHISTVGFIARTNNLSLTDEELVIAAHSIVASLSPRLVSLSKPLLKLAAPGLDTIVGAVEEHVAIWSINALMVKVRRIDFVPHSLIVRHPEGYVYEQINAVQIKDGGSIYLEMMRPFGSQYSGKAILVGKGRYAIGRFIGSVR